MSKLDSLKRYSTLVVDSGEIDALSKYAPTDATTNPTLILKAARRPDYRPLIEDARRHAASHAQSARQQAFIDKLYVNVGLEILKVIPGRVSTETAARLSFDTDAIIDQALRLIELYEAEGVERDRVLIKIASTWEGIMAAQELEKRGVRCNLTLMFTFAQALAGAQAGVTLVSPFVGHIYDWHKTRLGGAPIPVAADPGVAFVTRVFHHYKSHGYRTKVMGASFRSVEQIIALAGCDYLTCSPSLLDVLMGETSEVTPRLRSNDVAAAQPARKLDEKQFRWELNEDAMAAEKLAEGIRLFHADTLALLQSLDVVSAS